MKPNPKNFESFIDPEGGQWIRIKTGKFMNTIWRPADVKLEEEKMSFQCEFLTDPIEDPLFEKIAGSIIHDIISEFVENDKFEKK